MILPVPAVQRIKDSLRRNLLQQRPKTESEKTPEERSSPSSEERIVDEYA